MEHPRSIFGPLLLIATGAIWLLVKSGNLPAANLWALTHIWPYLLIAAGVGIILRPYWRYTPIVLDVIVIGGAVLAIYYAPKLGWANPTMLYMMGDNNFYVGRAETGSGKVISETRKASNFDTLEVSYPAQVFISQGSSESVKIEAEDNLLPGLQTEVRNGTLKIYYKAEDGKHVNPTRTVKITIVVKDLKEVNFESAGELTLEGIETDELNISVSGAGNLRLNEITARKLSVDLSGAGSMTASGTSNNLRVIISGFGSYDGKGMHSKTVDVDLSGAGSATVWVDDELNAQISGAGSINYYGTAEVTKQISGLGGVNHVGNK
jgi:Putative auto-transporter adhesin, head GIN domain